jgi:hypothetical protein
MLLNEFLKEHRKVEQQEQKLAQQETAIAQLQSAVTNKKRLRQNSGKRSPRLLRVYRK